MLVHPYPCHPFHPYQIRESAQDYMCDGVKYTSDLQSVFKNTPALPVATFRDAFFRIFQIKFSFPELGVLLGIIDPQGQGIIPGPEFLRWFYRLARLEEKCLVDNAASGNRWVDNITRTLST